MAWPFGGAWETGVHPASQVSASLRSTRERNCPPPRTRISEYLTFDLGEIGTSDWRNIRKYSTWQDHLLFAAYPPANSLPWLRLCALRTAFAGSAAHLTRPLPFSAGS